MVRQERRGDHEADDITERVQHLSEWPFDVKGAGGRTIEPVKEDRDNDQRGREHVVICVARKNGEDAATQAAEAERQRDQRRA